MHLSSSVAIAFNMLSRFLPVFCILLVIGAAIVEGKMSEEEKEKMKKAVQECKDEGHEAPTDHSEAWDKKYACFKTCFMGKLGILHGDELTPPEGLPHAEEIKQCFDEKKGDVTDKCLYSALVHQCMKEARDEE